MGNNQSSCRVLQLDNIEQHLSQCTQIETKICPLYGTLHHVRYQSMEFFLGKSTTQQPPSQLYLHYLVPPNLLVIPNFTLFENTKPQTYQELVQLMIGISKLLKNQDQIYVGKGRLGYANRWGIVGQQSINWPYKQVMKNKNVRGVYLSPTLIKQLSQQKQYPIHDPIKSDIFAIGIMLVEIIFSEDLSSLFDYVNFEIILKPLLEKLNIIRKQFGQQLYTILIKMLQLQQEQRYDFNSFYRSISNLERKNSYNFSASSRSKIIVGDLSNIKAKTPRRINPSPNRVTSPSQTKHRSPFNKDLRINSIYKQNHYPRLNSRSPASTKRTSISILTRK